MKKVLIIILTIISVQGFAQTRTQKEVLDSLEIKLPDSKQITPKVLKSALRDIIYKTEVLSKPKPIAVANSVADMNSWMSPHNLNGGFGKSVVLKWFRPQNATSFDIVLSKNPTLTSPVNYTTTLANFPITGLDTNQVYYWKVRGKNATVTGAWSNIRRFDTYKVPSGPNAYESIFDLIEYVPFVTDFSTYQYQSLKNNVEYQTFFRLGDKQMYNRHITGDVTIFPYTLQTGLSQIVLIGNETSCRVYYAYGPVADSYIDIAPYLSFSGGTLVLNQPVTTFPIAKIESYVNIFYLK